MDFLKFKIIMALFNIEPRITLHTPQFSSIEIQLLVVK